MLNSATANQLPGPPHFVDLHVNPGESVSIQFFDGNETVLRGPTTIKMISQHAYPPMPMPVQVPPGHMIQQIVDEHGTLKHIILSALNSNGAINSAYISNQQQQQLQLQLQQQQSCSCCCCCNNFGALQPPPVNAANAATAPASLTASVAATGTPLASVNHQMIHQPQLNHHSPATMAVFPPLSHSPASTYVRTTNRRSTNNRNYSSPNKRSSSYQNNNVVNQQTNYYNSTSPVTNTKPNGRDQTSRYMKSSFDNLSKSNYHYNRYNSNNIMYQYDRSSIYDQMSSNEIVHNNNNTATKYSTTHSNKSLYDYSACNNNNNSSNASQTSQTTTMDQMNDNHNLKYYKDQYDSVEDVHFTAKKSFNSLNSEPPSSQNRTYLDEMYTPEDDNLTNERDDAENMSQKSFLTDSIDSTKHGYISNEANNYDANYHNNINVTQHSSNFVDSNKSTSAKPVVFKNETKNGSKKIQDKSQNDCNATTITANCDSESILNKKSLDINSSSSTDQKSISDIQPIIVLEDNPIDNNCDISVNSKSDTVNGNLNSEVKVSDKTKDEKCWFNNSDNKLSIANGHLVEHLLDVPDSNSGSEQIETDKTESESDENESRVEPSTKDQSISTPSRSPKHLLPKIEALTLNYTHVTSSSIRLKWNFNQPNQYPEQKRHYIVDLLLNHQSSEDTPITRMAHQGPNTSCRIGHLQPQHEYMFRVRTSTDTCWLVSNILTVVTPESTPSFNRSGRRTNKQLHHQVTQQQQLIYQQQQLLHQHQIMEQQEKQKSQQQTSLMSLNSDLLMNPGGVVSADQGYAFFLVAVFTIISLIVAVLINHLLGNHW